MVKRAARIVFDEWDTYVAQSDGKPLFVSFDVEAARTDLTDTLTHCARVIIPIHKPNRNGGPVQPESDRLYVIEDDLCASLSEHGVRCRLVGRLTCDGVRELVFQVDDWDTFRPPVGLWMQHNGAYAIDVSEHEGWSFFDDCIRPTPEIWIYLADQRVVQNLIKSGSNPSKPHDLEFVFHGQDESLRKLAHDLQGRGYRPLADLEPGKGEVVLVKTMPLDTEGIAAESLAHIKLTQEHDVRYDGWGAQVVR
jgi:regulator of RNase E activity RraB